MFRKLHQRFCKAWMKLGRDNQTCYNDEVMFPVTVSLLVPSEEGLFSSPLMNKARRKPELHHYKIHRLDRGASRTATCSIIQFRAVPSSVDRELSSCNAPGLQA
jgi:hypothetical protein